MVPALPTILIVEDNLDGVFDLQQSVLNMGIYPTYLAHCTETAQEIIANHKPGLIICDIFFDSGPKGLDLLRRFPAASRQFIMVTSSPDSVYYDATNSLGAGGHLVRPFHPLTLRSIMDQALRELLPEPATTLPCLFIRGAQNQHIRIEFSDILYIYSERNYIFIKTRDSRFTLKRSLNKLMEELDGRFLRVHNSYIINTDYLKAIATSTLLIDKEIIPLGRAYRKNLAAYRVK